MVQLRWCDSVHHVHQMNSIGTSATLATIRDKLYEEIRLMWNLLT